MGTDELAETSLLATLAFRGDVEIGREGERHQVADGDEPVAVGGAPAADKHAERFPLRVGGLVQFVLAGQEPLDTGEFQDAAEGGGPGLEHPETGRAGRATRGDPAPGQDQGGPDEFIAVRDGPTTEVGMAKLGPLPRAVALRV